MARADSLPPPPNYKDLPEWEHNFDNLRIRAINAAWNLLLKADCSEISFGDLARLLGVTPAALYHHIPSLQALAEELALASLIKLRKEIGAAFTRTKKILPIYTAFFEFARRRPHHFSLAYSPRFNSSKQVSQRRRHVASFLDDALEKWLARKLKPREREKLHVLAFGGGLAVAIGATTVGEAMGTFATTVDLYPTARQLAAAAARSGD